MKKSIQESLSKSKRNLERSLGRGNRPQQRLPMLRAGNINYELSGRTNAIDCGGTKPTWTRWERTGCRVGPLREVQMLIGHSNIVTTRRCAHVSKESLREAIENLEESATQTTTQRKVLGIDEGR